MVDLFAGPTYEMPYTSVPVETREGNTTGHAMDRTAGDTKATSATVDGRLAEEHSENDVGGKKAIVEES